MKSYRRFWLRLAAACSLAFVLVGLGVVGVGVDGVGEGGELVGAGARGGERGGEGEGESGRQAGVHGRASYPMGVGFLPLLTAPAAARGAGSHGLPWVPPRQRWTRSFATSRWP